MRIREDFVDAVRERMNNLQDDLVVVVDPGSYSVKCGLGGDEIPRVVVPSVFGTKKDKKNGSSVHCVGKSDLGLFDGELQVKDIVVKGKIVDWEAFETVLQFAEDSLLGKEHALTRRFMFAEGYDLDLGDREKLCEILFEKFHAKGMFMMKSAPLALYACARSSGVVVDLGGDLSSVSIVSDGFLQKENIQVSHVSGKKLSQALLEELENERKIQVRPRYAFSKTVGKDGKVSVLPAKEEECECHPSYSRFWKLDLMDEMVASIAQANPVALDLHKQKTNETTLAAASTMLLQQLNNENNNSNNSKMDITENDDVYVLPDGTEVASASSLGKSITELYFVPTPLGRPELNIGIVDLIVKSAQQNISNADQRRDLLASVVLCGGGSAIPGLPERMAGELATKSRGMKSRIIVSGPEHRKYCTWVGGSILSTLSSLNDLWVNKNDYQDHGAKAVNRKCP